MENTPHIEKEHPFVEYRHIRGGDILAVFKVSDGFGDREVAYNKKNLEMRIENLKANGHPTAEAERILAEWPK